MKLEMDEIFRKIIMRITGRMVIKEFRKTGHRNIKVKTPVTDVVRRKRKQRYMILLLAALCLASVSFL